MSILLYNNTASNLMKLLDDLITTYCTIANQISEEKIKEYHAIINAHNADFEQYTGQLRKEITEYQNKLDPKTAEKERAQFEQLYQRLTDLTDKHENFAEGMAELEESIHGMPFSKASLNRFDDMIKRCVNQLTDMCITTGIKPEAIIKIQQLAKAYHFPKNELYCGKAVDGTYFITYTAHNSELIRDLLKQTLYELGRATRPTEEQVKTLAQNTVDISDATVTKVAGLSDDMAEMLISNGAYSSNVVFAPLSSESRENNETLIYRSGEAAVSGNRFNTACKMIMDSAITLSGQKGIVESKNVKKSRKENEKIMDAIMEASDTDSQDVGGKVIFIRAYHEKSDEYGNPLWSNNTDVPYLDEHIDFDENHFARYTRNVKNCEVYSNLDADGYSHSLNLAIYSGDSNVEKRYFNREECKKIEDRAQKAFSLCREFPVRDLGELDAILKKEFANLAEKTTDFKDHSPETEALRERSKQVEILIDNLNQRKYEDIPENRPFPDIRSLTDSAYARAAYMTRTKTYMHTDEIKAEESFKKYADKMFDGLAFNFSPGMAQVAGQNIISSVKDLNYFEFLDFEQQRLNNKEITEQQYTFEETYYSNGAFDRFKQEIISHLENVSLEVENVCERNPLIETYKVLQSANHRLDQNEKLIEDKMDNITREREKEQKAQTRSKERDDITR